MHDSSLGELDLWLDGGLTAGGVALVSGAVAVRRGQDPLTVEDISLLDPAQINGFDGSATAQWSTTAAAVSNALVLTLMAAPLGLAIATPGSRKSWTVAAMYGEVFLVGNGLVELLKGVTNRARPFVYNADPDIPDAARLEVKARRAFPSGHTANAFAAAVFLSSVYAKLRPGSSATKWMWAGSLTLAAPLVTCATTGVSTTRPTSSAVRSLARWSDGACQSCTRSPASTSRSLPRGWQCHRADAAPLKLALEAGPAG